MERRTGYFPTWSEPRSALMERSRIKFNHERSAEPQTKAPAHQCSKVSPRRTCFKIAGTGVDLDLGNVPNNCPGVQRLFDATTSRPGFEVCRTGLPCFFSCASVVDLGRGIAHLIASGLHVRPVDVPIAFDAGWGSVAITLGAVLAR